MRRTPPRWLSKLFPPNTRRTVCPPGKLTKSADALPLVVVASFPRSGTHLLIDLILNNFARYRRAPLYVNLDEYILQGWDVDDLIRKGGYLVKTHFPEPNFAGTNREAYEKVFANAILLAPRRDEQEIFRSYQQMHDAKRKENVEVDHAAFWEYWGTKHANIYPFELLIDPAQTLDIVLDLEARLGLNRNPQLIGPPNKSRRLAIYCRKLATRVLGNWLTVVNTTVGFGRTDGPLPEPAEPEATPASGKIDLQTNGA